MVVLILVFNGSMGSLGRAIYLTLTLILFAILHNDMCLASIILGIVSVIAALPSFMLKVKILEEGLIPRN
ncbi:hypothetical protein [Sulfurisphaera javensis]